MQTIWYKNRNNNLDFCNAIHHSLMCPQKLWKKEIRIIKPQKVYEFKCSNLICSIGKETAIKEYKEQAEHMPNTLKLTESWIVDTFFFCGVFQYPQIMTMKYANLCKIKPGFVYTELVAEHEDCFLCDMVSVTALNFCCCCWSFFDEILMPSSSTRN